VNRAIWLAIAVIPALAAAVCPGQNRSHIYMDRGSERMLASPDVAFAMKAAQDGVAEVQLGRLAVEKAQNPIVRQFGQRMVDDGREANNRLNQIAKQQDMMLPANMAAGNQAQYDRLEPLSGDKFDQAYIKAMLKVLPTAIKAFSTEAKKGKDSAIRSFAAQNFESLQHQLAAAKSIAAGLMTTNA
jgi:putative membrane protein